MHLSFIGAGKMATAIAAGLIEKKVFAPHRMTAGDVAPAARDAFTQNTGVAAVADNAKVAADGDVIVLAVKPQDAAKVLEPLAGGFSAKLLISIAAGLRLARLQAWTGSDRIIRVMPNTPATVGLAASVYACAPGVTDDDRKLAQEVLSAIGMAWEMPEDKLDAVTAVSGSGPAFLFAYVEAMIKGAVELGLPADAARALVVQTIAGATEMLNRDLGTPAELRQAVTSKGGTTAAGLASLAADDFEAVIGRCLAAATNRSIELGQ